MFFRTYRELQCVVLSFVECLAISQSPRKNHVSEQQLSIGHEISCIQVENNKKGTEIIFVQVNLVVRLVYYMLYWMFDKFVYHKSLFSNAYFCPKCSLQNVYVSVVADTKLHNLSKFYYNRRKHFRVLSKFLRKIPVFGLEKLFTDQIFENKNMRFQVSVLWFQHFNDLKQMFMRYARYKTTKKKWFYSFM